MTTPVTELSFTGSVLVRTTRLSQSKIDLHQSIQSLLEVMGHAEGMRLVVESKVLTPAETKQRTGEAGR